LAALAAVMAICGLTAGRSGANWRREWQRNGSLNETFEKKTKEKHRTTKLKILQGTIIGLCSVMFAKRQARRRALLLWLASDDPSAPLPASLCVATSIVVLMEIGAGVTGCMMWSLSNKTCRLWNRLFRDHLAIISLEVLEVLDPTASGFPRCRSVAMSAVKVQLPALE
jgi:hypothetical protein